MRVLVAFEHLRYLYRELMVKAILDSRPTLDMHSASLEELTDVLAHFEPHVVVCSEPSGNHPESDCGAWVQIPTGDRAKTTSGSRGCA